MLTGRMQAMEQQMQFTAGQLGTSLPGIAATHSQHEMLQTPLTHIDASCVQGNSLGSVMQQLANLRTELSRQSQVQQQSSLPSRESADMSTELAEVKQRLDRQDSEVQQLQQETAVLQQGLTSQGTLTEDMQKMQQSLSCAVEGITSDVGRHVNDMQDTCSQLRAQHATHLSQHHTELSTLRAASVDHDEQLKQCSETSRRHGEQISNSEAFQQDAQQVLQRLSEHAEAIPPHIRAAGAVNSTA